VLLLAVAVLVIDGSWSRSQSRADRLRVGPTSAAGSHGRDMQSRWPTRILHAELVVATADA